MDISEADRWLLEARADLQTAEILFQAGRYNACAFYSQQAAEKALKALLFARHEVAWGHSTLELLWKVETLGEPDVTEDLRQAVRKLDLHYIPSRYPNAFPAGIPSEHYDENMGQEALEWARLVMNYVENRI